MSWLVGDFPASDKTYWVGTVFDVYILEVTKK